ncbi:hypothetical protein POL68_40460 [Stigmatella sp. ncwal1]|uniref:Uncharacterized protein n=1 Tax=Stigmatella ashevillensis TaxID=2995309 RepID=A0ABT5DM96_9BACT|nr:hypothetical protein [Stigmatella ashevillena]MDC0714792.1 hypothetical protein [Stigmatella ashevillena]
MKFTDGFLKRLLFTSVFSLPLAAVADGNNTFSGANVFTFYGNQSAPGGGPSVSPNNLTVCPNNVSEYDPSCKKANAQLLTPFSVISQTIEAASGGGQIVRGTLATDAYGGEAPVQYVSFIFEPRDFFSINPGSHIAIGARAFIPYTGSGLDPYTVAYGAAIPHAYGDGIILGGCGTESRGVAIEHFWAPYGHQNPPSNEVGGCKGGVFQDNQVYVVKVAVEKAVDAGVSVRIVKYQISQRIAWLGDLRVAEDLQGTSFPDRAAPNWGWRKPMSAAQRSSWYIANIFTAPSAYWSFRISNFSANTANQIPVGFFY